MVGHGAREEHDITRAHPVRAKLEAVRKHADPGRGDVHAIGRPLVDDFGVTGDDEDAGLCRGLGHIRGDSAQFLDRKAFLDDERGREPKWRCTGNGKVVDRPVHREMPDRTSGEPSRFDDERVGGERQAQSGRQ